MKNIINFTEIHTLKDLLALGYTVDQSKKGLAILKVSEKEQYYYFLDKEGNVDFINELSGGENVQIIMHDLNNPLGYAFTIIDSTNGDKTYSRYIVLPRLIKKGKRIINVFDKESEELPAPDSLFIHQPNIKSCNYSNSGHIPIKLIVPFKESRQNNGIYIGYKIVENTEDNRYTAQEHYRVQEQDTEEYHIRFIQDCCSWFQNGSPIIHMAITDKKTGEHFEFNTVRELRKFYDERGKSVSIIGSFLSNFEDIYPGRKVTEEY